MSSLDFVCATVPSLNDGARLDSRLMHVLYAGTAHGPWLWTMVVLTVIGSGWSMLAIAPFALLDRTRRVTFRLLLALVATSLVVFSLKAAVGRARPCASVADVHALVFAAPHDPSFPSGHAAGAFAFAAFLILEVVWHPKRAALTKGLLAAALIVVALGIALSRVVLGVHFPSDVMAGAAIGATIGAVVSRRFGRAARLAPAPSPSTLAPVKRASHPR